MVLWLKVTNDEYEFPIIVEDSIELLAKKCGIKAVSIRNNISKYNLGKIKYTSYKKVVIPDNEEEIGQDKQGDRVI